MEEPIQGPTELEKLQKENGEYLNNWKRSAADFANYKKGEVERAGLLVKYTKEDMVYKILPIIDNMYLAWQQLPEKLREQAAGHGSTGSPQVEWTKGFMQIQSQITDFLKKEGIEEVKTAGEKYNPETMEIVEEVEGEKDSGIVIEELHKGYIMDGKVLRPARVKVNK